ncbi:MAG: NAD(P)-dependent oxidoreductase [Sarcina sp.]
MSKITLHLNSEADRCLSCKNARCQSHCPINTDIPRIISLFKEDKIEEAGRILIENNPLSYVCSIVCEHERQCLGYCIKGIKDKPVEFYKIEEYISGQYLKNHKFPKKEHREEKVAIVGSGPSGITVALELAMKGYDVTIFEVNPKIGGVLRYGIPDFRLAHETIDLMEQRLIELGVKIKYNTSVLDDIKIENLFKDGYKAIFLGLGLTKAKGMGVQGETLGNVHYAIDYLKSPESYDLGNNVAVIGAGNVAMDAARTIKRTGAKTTVYYRRGFEDMTAAPQELREAQEEGVIFDLFKAPIKISDNGMMLIKTEKKENPDGGRARVVSIDGTEEIIDCTSVVIAISQEAKEYSGTSLKFSDYGLLEVDEYGKTSIDGIYAAGDIVTGAKTVVHAVEASKKVANSIDEYIKKLSNN